MSEKRMTLAEFLVWDDGTNMRYEFVRGRPRAMAPTSGRHGVVQDNAAAAIRERLGRDGPCRVVQQPGILLKVRNDGRYYVADLAVTCRPVSQSPYIDEPKLVVEIISPSTGRSDKDIKVPDYCSLASVDKVWLIDSRRPVMQVWQRLNGQWIGSLPLQPGQSFESRLLGGSVEVGDLFEGTGLEVADQEPKEALDRTDAQAEEGQS